MIKRKIFPNVFELEDKRKDSSTFLEGYVTNDYIKPMFFKISDDDALTFYRGNEWVNACIDKIVNDCVKFKPKVVLKDKSKDLRPRHRIISEHFDDFFKKPNVNKESFKQLRKKFVRDLLIYGRGSYEKVYSNSGILEELYAIRASRISILADEYGNLKENKTYKYESKNGKKVYYAKNECIFCVLNPISGDLYGEKKLDTLANTVASDILRATYNSNFFINNAEASGILSLEGMSKSELQKFRQYWKENHRGVDKAHRMIAVNTKMAWARMALTNKDMEFTEYGKELRLKIASVFHVPPLEIGILDGSNGSLSSNAETQDRVYKEGALKPILELEKETYDQEILVDGFGVTDMEIEFEGIDLLDQKTQSEIDSKRLADGVMVINEVRSRLGMPDVPWGNTPISTMPGGMQVNPDTGKLENPRNENQSSGNNSSEEPVEDDDTDDEEKAMLFSEYLNKYMSLKKFYKGKECELKCVSVIEGFEKRLKDAVSTRERFASIEILLEKDFVKCFSLVTKLERD